MEKWTVKSSTKFPSNYVRSATLYEILLFMFMDIAFLFALIVYNFLLKCPFKLSIRKFHRMRYRSDDAYILTYIRTNGQGHTTQVLTNVNKTLPNRATFGPSAQVNHSTLFDEHKHIGHLNAILWASKLFANVRTNLEHFKIFHIIQIERVQADTIFDVKLSARYIQMLCSIRLFL